MIRREQRGIVGGLAAEIGFQKCDVQASMAHPRDKSVKLIVMV
jgi:hypothetical protein